ncbi:hypothetical protein [Clostridium massiliamazoniense]|uniref:hypothetical protein n=1 Tax=Clostridium massiliamazoniense TaxID=1347366 RepID=UPI0006D763A2|nr:hypothetical protein [Clostridium massiliamazoniense]
MVDKHGLVINENNKQTYNDFKAKASIINKNNDAKTFAEKLATEIKFESSKEYDWTKYVSILENNSEFNFDYIYYNVQFKDKDGVVVDDGIINLNKFSAKSKQKVDVSTNKEHETVTVELDSFSLKE